MTTRSFIDSLGAAQFRQLLLRWYRKHQRKLPWRGETDPYRILVSEIMLQQTRVAVVEDRYKKFVARFPSVKALARAKEQTVLAAWSGLGYYRRARNLHAAAKLIVKDREFPRTAEALRELPGIGRYTANAVASIAFGEAVPVVDGNVKRVLQRLTGRSLSEEQHWQMAGELLAVKSPGDFNQVMMELGAMVCLPATPLCEVCPIIKLCASRGAHAQPKRATRKKAVLKYSLCLRDGSVLLQQRAQTSSLMPGMWELPILSGSQNGDRHTSVPLMKLKHSITITDYSVLVFAGKSGPGQWVPLRNTGRVALTGLTRKILGKLKEIDA
ncbi:MAG TPA: A/G-specific adenine glycosylase [Candidatus Angelobacter sp.]|jgi:A/G-specific adenine glycosylase